jgi:hypothetical protein
MVAMLRLSYALGTALALVLAARSAQAQPIGYARSAGIGVTNGGVATLTDHQVRLVVNTQALIAAGQMRADANDMVFTRATCAAPVLGHWIESGLNTASTVVWVKVPSLPVGLTRLVMWHSNPSAAATSSPRNVFIGTGVANDPISSTNQVIVSMTNTADNTQRGFRFSPNTPVLIVEFGKREPTGSTKTITLFDFATQAIVRQATVSGPAASYVYNPTPPFWLTAGTQYSLQIYGAPGDSYYYGVSSQIAPDLTYLDLRYCNSCTQNTFPTQVLAGYHYGNPDFRYYKRSISTPEPAQDAVTGTCVEAAMCDADCTPSMCGDGVVNVTAGEQCDDGNSTDTDTCRNNCSPGGGGGGMGGGSGSGGAGAGGAGTGGAVAGGAGTGGAATGGIGGMGTGGTATGGTGTSGEGGEGGESQAGQAGEGGTTATGGRATGGRSTGGRGGSTTGGRSSGGTGGTRPGEGGEAGDGDSDGDRVLTEGGCGCRTHGSRSLGSVPIGAALLGLLWIARARRRKTRPTRG